MRPTTLPSALGPLAGLALLVVPALPGAAQVTVTTFVPGTSNPYLAGMPGGSTASNGDSAPAQSPAQVIGIVPRGGDAFTFSATGGTAYALGIALDPPEGDVNFIIPHDAGAENGISNVRMPADALLGVFLGPGQPNLNPAPSTLDFSTSASRDYLSLLPAVQQVFYIGDGLTGAGIAQKIVAPAGATRLYLGTMDGSGWYNNQGSFIVRVTAAPVPEASTTVSLGLLLALGVILKTGGLVFAAKRKKAHSSL